MPRLVDEMAVARNRIDLASDGFEIFIFFSEILKLRGAHERKVRRIEEKHGPLPEDIGLGHGLEGVVLKSLIDQGHNYLLWFSLVCPHGHAAVLR